MADARSEAEKLFDRGKARLRHQIMLDREINPTVRAVGYLIADLIDFEKGYAWPPHTYLAEQLGLSLRTIQNSIKNLNAYFDVELTGRSHRYHPRWKEIQARFAGVEPKTRAKLAGVDHETPAKFASVDHPIPAKCDTNTGKNLPVRYATNSTLSYLETSSNILGSAAAASDEHAAKWTAVKARLGNRLLDRVDLIQIYESEVMLAAPSKLVQSRLEVEYLGQLAAAWERVLGFTVRVVVLHFASAAE